MIIDQIDYKKRINYFKGLKLNKFHIINFNVIKERNFTILEKILGPKLNFENKIFFEKKNANFYFLNILFKKLPWIQKIKFILPKFFIRNLRNLLLNFKFFSNYKPPINQIESKFLNKFFIKQIRYYNLFFKKKSYITLNKLK